MYGNTLIACRNDRYDDLRACLGEGLLQKLREQRIFMVSIHEMMVFVSKKNIMWYIVTCGQFSIYMYIHVYNILKFKLYNEDFRPTKQLKCLQIMVYMLK